MAQKTTLVDDLDRQTKGAETHRLTLDDRTIEIDLAGPNLDKLTKALAPYFERGREVTKRVASNGNGDTAKVRDWLRSQSKEVNDKGRIPATSRTSMTPRMYGPSDGSTAGQVVRCIRSSN
jgi:hypothetical protein